jgi:glycosyltransferase involved in cell wall biosynthesis
MKKKIIVSGPILSRSGYGDMARFAIRALRRHEEKFDIYLLVLPWGATGWIFEDSEEREYIDSLVKKTQLALQASNNNLAVDISIQISIPNEWKKMAPINIGYTAGIETNFISPAWLQPSMQMDKIIVISEHAKSSFANTVFSDNTGKNFKVTTPVDVVHFPDRKIKPKQLDLQLDYDFNFLLMAQISPRKNVEQAIKDFITEFRNEEVGLVLKVNAANDSTLDRERVFESLKNLIASEKDRKCKIYLLHGSLSEEEIQGLYNHPKIKALVSTTHGEGFGFPMFDATLNEIPVIATDWSGHLDFLSAPDDSGKEKKLFAKVDFELKPVAQEHVWQGVLEAGTSWAYPISTSVKSRMREVYKDYPRFKTWAKKLAAHNKEKFSEEKIYENFIEHLKVFDLVSFTDGNVLVM